jgi:hypothetical protein
MKIRVFFTNRILLACALVGLVVTAGANPPEGRGLEKAAEYSSVAFDKSAALKKRAEQHAWLMSESVARGKGAAIRAEVSAAEVAEIDNTSRSLSPERVGLTKPLSVSIDFRDVKPGQLSGRVLGRPNGNMTGTSDGGYVYTSTLSSGGATALRVHFTGFHLADNASVYLYTENGQVFGPYTGQGPNGDGEFWSHTVMGDSIYLQLRHEGQATSTDLRGTGFNVAGLGHVRPRWLGFCSGNASCVVNVNDATPAVAVSGARNAVAHMQWISGPFIYICTGGLVADTDDSSTVPYFLSANHCISRGKDARSLENFFQFDAPANTSGGCDDIIATRNNHLQSLRTLGARIVHTASNTDHTLFELKQSAPAGSAYLGWNENSVANSNGTDLYRISHPGGAPQAYSTHEVDTSAGTCTTWPRGDRIYSRDVIGATEGGSSGSPVVNSLGQIVGQLSGACGTNLDDQCDSTRNATVDGAFAAYFSEVAQWLHPDGGASCEVTEASETSCSDGLDNDCDSFIDAADSDCDSGGGGGGDVGFPVGASCVSNDECASNKCKGRSGAMTCK